MLVALPAAIAFGVLTFSAIGPDHAGAGALAGILGAAALGIVAPLVSRNSGFITAPCAPATAVMSALAVQLSANGQQPFARVTALLALTILLSSLLQIVYGLLRAGKLIKFIPYQVVSGYLSGVALIIALGQLPKLLGLPKGTTLWQGLLSPSLWHGASITVGAVTIAAMLLAPKLTQKMPGAIIGLVAGIATYFVLAIFDPQLLTLAGNTLIIGPIEVGGSIVDAVKTNLSNLMLMQPADIGTVGVTAITLSLLLSIDTLKTGVVLDTLARRRSDSNRELIGQGAANTAACFVGGIPGAGTMGATLVNFTSGGRTLWSGVIEGVLVVVTLLLLGHLIAWVPIGALAGLLLVVAWRMFDLSVFRLGLERSTRVDFLIILTVIGVAQIELIAASVVGICLAILIFIRDQIRGTVIISKVDLHGARSKRRRLADENHIIEQNSGQAAIVQLQGNLFFGTTDQLFSELEQDLNTRRYLLLDLRRVQSMDYTAGHLFEQMRERVLERKGELLFSGMPSSLPTRQDIEHYMQQLGLGSGRAGIRIFDTRDGALEWIEDRLLEAAGALHEKPEQALALADMELFSKLEADAIATLAGAVREIAVPAQSNVFARGDTTDDIFFVRRGRVEVLLPLDGGKVHHLVTFCQGDFFGEMAFLDPAPRSADVRAAIATELYALSRERFDALTQSNPAVGVRVFEKLAVAVARRLRMADTELRMLEAR